MLKNHLVIIPIFFLSLSVIANPANCKKLLAHQKNTLSLSYSAFDQTPAGWRYIGDKKCYKEAAALIQMYIANQKLQDWEKANLYFHAGQLYSFANDYQRALSMFSHATWNVPTNSPVLWNQYVKATMAFLRKDLNGLRKYRDELQKISNPANAVNLLIVENMVENINAPYAFVYKMKH